MLISREPRSPAKKKTVLLLAVVVSVLFRPLHSHISFIPFFWPSDTSSHLQNFRQLNGRGRSDVRGMVEGMDVIIVDHGEDTIPLIAPLCFHQGYHFMILFRCDLSFLKLHVTLNSEASQSLICAFCSASNLRLVHYPS